MPGILASLEPVLQAKASIAKVVPGILLFPVEILASFLASLTSIVSPIYKMQHDHPYILYNKSCQEKKHIDNAAQLVYSATHYIANNRTRKGKTWVRKSKLKLQNVVNANK